MEIKGLRVGNRVRVTSLQAVRGWQGWQLITVPAGRQLDGTVDDLNKDGFFDLRLASGELQNFNAYDTSIEVIRIVG